MAPITNWGNIRVKTWCDPCKNKDKYLNICLVSFFLYSHTVNS